MKRLRQLLEDSAEDHGAALVLALIIVTVIGLAGAALLTFSDTSIRTTVALRDQAGNAYNADGAAQVAIDSLSKGYGFTSPPFTSPPLFDNATGTPCFGTYGATLNLPDFYPATSGNGTAPGSASVDCSADPNSGANAVPINIDNRPKQALLTLGAQSAEAGIDVKALGRSGTFWVSGAVASNSYINVTNGTLHSDAAVTAVKECSTSNIFGTSIDCNKPANLKADPAYASEVGLDTPANEVLTYRSVPASCASNEVVTFSPGYYDDAVALSTLMSGSCTWWFRPGIYYFDFHNNASDADAYLGSRHRGSDQWQITGGSLVAGTPKGSHGTVLVPPGPNPVMPGSCKSPRRNVRGVQFIFGGDSGLALGGSANAEICGTYSASRPPIAIYGLRTGAATTTILGGTGSGAGAELKMSTVTNPGDFLSPTEVIEENDHSATWNKAGTTPQTSIITVSGYAPSSPIPAGSIVKSATVRVRHGNSSGYRTRGSSRDSLALTFTPRGGTAISLAPILTSGRGLNTDPIDVGDSDFVKFVHDNGFTGADLAYAATLNRPGIESLDSIQIDITYVAPAFRSQDMDTTVLSTSTPPLFGELFIQGTTYTPLAAIRLRLQGDSRQVLGFGVISRTFSILEIASYKDLDDVKVITVPDISGDGAPVVILTVYVCPAATTSTCSTDPGKIKALRVKAIMSDPAPSSPPSKMTILSWSNLR